MNTKVDRSLIVKLIVITAVALLAVWIMNNTYWGEETVPKGLSGEAATNPFYAAQKLSDAVGAHSEWKHVLGDLPERNAVIVLSYWHWDVIARRREQLQQWVSDGGRLVLDDSLIANDSSLKDWLGIEYQDVPTKDDEEAKTGIQKEHNDTKSKLKLFNIKKTDCEHLTLIDHRIDADPDRSTYQLCTYGWWRYLIAAKPVQWGLRDSHGLQAVRVNVGRGSVTLFNASPFLYREILSGEHGLLFVAAAQLHRGDHIYFLMDEDGVPLLKLIWRYGSPVVVLGILLVLAALWRNGVRFGPMATGPDSARRSLAEQIIGTGHFILRFNGDQALHAATVRALNDAERRHIANYDRLSSQDRIDTLARATATDAEALGNAIHFKGKRRVMELRHAIALLEHARRHLLDAGSSHLKTNIRINS